MLSIQAFLNALLAVNAWSQLVTATGGRLMLSSDCLRTCPLFVFLQFTIGVLAAELRFSVPLTEPMGIVSQSAWLGVQVIGLVIPPVLSWKWPQESARDGIEVMFCVGFASIW